MTRMPVGCERLDVRSSTGARISGYRLPATGYRLSRGFSLIELVAVLVLIALVFAMVTLSF